MSRTLKALASAVLLLLNAALCGQTPPAAQAAPDQVASSARVLPLAPDALMSLLPTAPAPWKVVSSVATNQLGSWLTTIARREIQAPPPAADATGSADRAQPMRTVIALIDAGFDPSASAVFANFQPSRSANGEKILYRGYPVIRTIVAEHSESLQALINRRFLVQIETQNQPKDASLSWLQRIPLERYNIPAGAAVGALPSEVTITSLDELNPANNHSSKRKFGSRTSRSESENP